MTRPVGEMALVKRDGGYTPTSSLLIVQDHPELEIGTVLATGPGRWVSRLGEYVALDVNEGDKVLFNRYAGRDWWDHQGRDWVVLSPEEILAVVLS